MKNFSMGILNTFICLILVIAAILYWVYVFSENITEIFFVIVFVVSCLCLIGIFFLNRNESFMKDYFWNKKYQLLIFYITCTVLMYIWFYLTAKQYLLINYFLIYSIIPIIGLRVFYKYIIARKKNISAYAPFLALIATIYFFLSNLPTITYTEAQQMVLEINSNYEIVNENVKVVHGIEGAKDSYLVTVGLEGNWYAYFVNPYTKEIDYKGLESNLWDYE